MKERLLTFALAIAAFALFYALMAPKPAPPQERVTRPISTEKGPNGYLALMRWLEAEGVQPLSLRERYNQLERTTRSGSPTGNLLITTTPHLYPIRNSEVAALRTWIAEGNTMLVVAGLSDTPDWSMNEGYDGEFMQHMESMTELTFVQMDAEGAKEAVNDPAAAQATPEATQPEPDAKEDDDETEPSLRETLEAMQKLTEPQRFELVPNGPHPLFEGVKSVDALSEYPAARWRASSETADLILELAQNAETADPVLWLLRYGKGQVIISAYGSLFTNKQLGKSDNARLFANIVEWSLQSSTQSRGRVIIDDAHQGLVAFYDPDAFFGDNRLHRSLWWLVGLWLIFVLGPQRLRAGASGWNPVDITSFVRASGGFMARVLKPADAGKQLFANFFNDLRRRTGLPVNGAPLWDWMSERSTISTDDVARLRDLHGKVLRGQRIDLSKLQNLLVSVRRQLI